MKGGGLIFGAVVLAAIIGSSPATPTPEPTPPVDVKAELQKQWPNNRPIIIAAFGHSVPSGYFVTPAIHTFESYPHLFHKALAEAYPSAQISVLSTGKGGEESPSGAARFDRDVLSHRPDIITIDYGLNDVRVGLPAARTAWATMIEKAKASGAMVILLTPTRRQNETAELAQHAQQIRDLGELYDVPVADSYAVWTASGDIPSLLSSENHPNLAGHQLVATELKRASGL